MTTAELFSNLKIKLASRDPLVGTYGIYQFRLTGDNSGEYYVILQGQEYEVNEGRTGDATVTITMAATSFKDMVEGQVAPYGGFFDR